MSIYLRGKSWYFDIYVGGRRFRKRVPGGKTRAKDIEAELKTKFRLKQLKIEDIEDPLPFVFVAEQYLRYSKGTKAPRTYELDLTSYKHLASFFGGYVISDISNNLLLKYQAEKKKEGYSNRTVNIHIGILRKIMKYAKGPKIEYPMLPESERTHAFLTPEETKRFLQCFTYDLAFKRVLFGYMTGLRPAELTYLSWDDIDFEMETAKITSKTPLWTVKTKQERVIPLNKTALKILQDIVTNGHKGRWVFSNTDKPVKSIRRSIDTAAKRAGIKKKVTPNMLRHTFTTHALMKGADIKSIQEILGHSDIHTTMRYLHPIKEALRRTVELLETVEKDRVGD